MAMYTFAQLFIIQFKLSMICLLTVFQPTIKRIFKERK